MALATPRISVIIPAYNAEETIQRACLSALNQSWPEVEVVAVNDGSGDCTGEILDNLACEHPNLRVIHQRNGGVSKARNTGLDSMTGEIVCFLDTFPLRLMRLSRNRASNLSDRIVAGLFHLHLWTRSCF